MELLLDPLADTRFGVAQAAAELRRLRSGRWRSGMVRSRSRPVWLCDGHTGQVCHGYLGVVMKPDFQLGEHRVRLFVYLARWTYGVRQLS